MIKGDLKTQARAAAFPSPLPRATGGSTAATAARDVDPPFCPVIVAPVPLWRNGRRGRLKICCSQGRGGSSPSRGTKGNQSFRGHSQHKRRIAQYVQVANRSQQESDLGVPRVWFRLECSVVRTTIDCTYYQHPLLGLARGDVEAGNGALKPLPLPAFERRQG
jgi:hypothetical protein